MCEEYTCFVKLEEEEENEELLSEINERRMVSNGSIDYTAFVVTAYASSDFHLTCCSCSCSSIVTLVAVVLDGVRRLRQILSHLSSESIESLVSRSVASYRMSPTESIGPKNESNGRKNQVAYSQLTNMINMRKKPI